MKICRRTMLSGTSKMTFPVFLWIAVCFTAETVLGTDTRKECKEPMVENGYITSKPTYWKIQCDYGYRLLGEDRITCKPDGTLSKNPPYCQEITCPRIFTLLNGTISPNPPKAKIGATANISCDDYHLLMGAERMTCTIDGIWKPNRMVHCHEVRCPDFPGITHGGMHPSTPARPGYVDLFCDKGFKLDGPSRLYCTEDGKWSPNVMPSCSVECEAHSYVVAIVMSVVAGMLAIVGFVAGVLWKIGYIIWTRGRQYIPALSNANANDL